MHPRTHFLLVQFVFLCAEPLHLCRILHSPHRALHSRRQTLLGLIQLHLRTFYSSLCCRAGLLQILLYSPLPMSSD